MYTLRLTRTLLDQFDPADPEDDPGEVSPTTRLGDWYVMPIDAGGRHLLLCTSEKSLLSVVFPADHLDELPEQLATALVGVLHRLGASRESIVAEARITLHVEVAEPQIRPALERIRDAGRSAGLSVKPGRLVVAVVVRSGIPRGSPAGRSSVGFAWMAVVR